MAIHPIDTYRRQIEKALQAGNATEHTHRPALKTLVESLAAGITSTNEPKRVACGAPDFVVSRRAQHGAVTVGHIETKDVGEPLDEVGRSDQLKRYRSALPNLILTDYLEFRWYVGGEDRQTARLARVMKDGKLAPEKDGATAVTELLIAFLSQQAEPIRDPKMLALRMAKLTHFIRDMIVTAFEKQSASPTLRDLHGAFEKALIPDLPIPQFADMFAQTLAYGLFAARCNHHGPAGSFKRLGAAKEIPKTNPFLRQLFETITGTALDEEPFAGFVDDLAQLLADTIIEGPDGVLADFGKRTARQDPVVHFYETFLAAYDPKLREARGVYYTPEPVVSYIVRSVDYLLKTRFGCPNGLADTTSAAAVPAVAPASRWQEKKEAGATPALRDAGATAEELRIRNRGHLPHWEREDGTYFVTFRLADSLPKSVLESFEFERKQIARRAEQQKRKLTAAEEKRLEELYTERVESYLDSGAGACHLAKPEIAELVADALRHFDGDRYRLLAWCVLPNHVHVVFAPSPGQTLDMILHSWKSYTAHKANEILHRQGEFWQREYYDHLIRDEEDLYRVLHYVAENPAKAHLKDWRWVWVAPASRWQENDAAETAALPRVLILDPACGTGTFLYAVIDHIRSEFMQQGNAGMWSGYVRNHLLPRIFGFELLMAPYAVAHFKLGMQLAGQDLHTGLREQWAYDFADDVAPASRWQGKDAAETAALPQRLGVFLTNTLEEAERRAQFEFGFLRTLAEEANATVRIKRELPILAVIGNPPYSGHSANRSWEVKKGKKVATFIGQLIKDYYFVDGKPLGERNPKWLQDDYVKFIRWGQWRIERTGAGILAFITNNGYLDNPTFRGMRQQLMNAFTEIYLLDLHGNSKKKEKAPDGSKDENVFDIQQGVTLGIFIKEPARSAAVPAAPSAVPQRGTAPQASETLALHRRTAKVHHRDLWGLREGKYRTLLHTDVKSTKWTQLTPRSPVYLFVPQDGNLFREYTMGWNLADALPVNSVGIVTARDSLTLHWSKDSVWKTVKDFANLSPEDAREKYELGPDAQDWKVELAQQDIRESGPGREKIATMMYRPLDWRFTYYTGRASGFICRPRPEVMRHLLNGKNLALLATRQTRDQWDVFVARTPVGHKSLSAYDITGVFPLFLIPDQDGEKQGQGDLREIISERTNLAPTFIRDIGEKLGLSFLDNGHADLRKTFGPEDVFNYIYSVFHSLTYRSRYAEFLKSDFPRLPLTSDTKLFRTLCGLGGELVALHLLESPKLNKPISRFPIKGPNLVEKGFPKYVAPGEPEPGTGKKLSAGRVYISKGDPRSAGLRPATGAAETAALPQGGREGQYFEGVPPEVWNFHIGGYQVCEKWLKDRRERTLAYEDLEHYPKVVTALQETIRLMAAIDAAIPKWPIE